MIIYILYMGLLKLDEILIVFTVNVQQFRDIIANFNDSGHNSIKIFHALRT